jgi:hypothetical protein
MCILRDGRAAAKSRIWQQLSTWPFRHLPVRRVVDRRLEPDSTRAAKVSAACYQQRYWNLRQNLNSLRLFNLRHTTTLLIMSCYVKTVRTILPKFKRSKRVYGKMTERIFQSIKWTELHALESIARCLPSRVNQISYRISLGLHLVIEAYRAIFLDNI